MSWREDLKKMNLDFNRAIARGRERGSGSGPYRSPGRIAMDEKRAASRVRHTLKRALEKQGWKNVTYIVNPDDARKVEISAEYHGIDWNDLEVNRGAFLSTDTAQAITQSETVELGQASDQSSAGTYIATPGEAAISFAVAIDSNTAQSITVGQGAISQAFWAGNAIDELGRLHC